MRSDSKTLAAAAVLGLAYYVAAVIGLQWAAVGGAGSPVWPAAGVGLAGLVLGGVRLWPAIVVARLAAGLTVGSTHPISVEVVIALGNAASAALPALALVSWFGLDRRLAAMRDILALALAAGVGALISAGFGAGALWLSMGLGTDFALATAAFWWFGAFVGAITLAPPILAWSGFSNGERAALRRAPLDVLHLAAVLAVTGALAGHVFLNEAARDLGTWLIYPPLIWAALAFQVRGASLALVAVAGAATIGATFGRGPFDLLADSAQDRVVLAQHFSAATALVTLVLAAIADERRGAEGIRRSQARLSNVLESTTDSVMVLDRAWRFTYLNARAAAQIGGGRSLVGERIWDVFPGALGGPFFDAYTRAMETGRPTRADAFYAPLDTWFEANAYPSAEGLTIFFRDVTEERRTAATLAQSEARLRAVLEQMSTGVSVAQAPSGELLFHNTKGEEILGHSLIRSGDTSGYAAYGARHPDGSRYAPDEYPIARALLAGEVVDREPMVYRRGDGSLTDLEVSAAPIRDANGTIVLAVSTFEDVSERKRAEEALLASEERLRLAQEAGGIATWEWSIATGDVTWTGPMETLLDLPPGAPSPRYDAFMERTHPADRDGVAAAIEAALAGRAPFDVEFRILRPEGGARWLAGRGEVVRDARGRPVRMIGVNYDITERREARAALERLNADLEARVAEGAAKLVQLQKMESLGQLTGGVAHDFNNLLMAVMSSLGVLRKRFADDPRAERLIANAIEGAERGVSLTQRMLAFARRQTLAPSAVEVPDLVVGMTDLLRRSIGPQVRIETRFCEGTPRALVDPNQLELALVNLAVNARDAMPEGGVLTIAVDAVTRAAEDEPPQGRFVRVRISDTGAGMDEATLARAVEPFFTTKGPGKGTGLGLAMVYGLAEQSNGRLALASAPGAGTTAEILLPIAHAPFDAEPVRAPEPAPAAVAGRRLRVLVVDDDALVLMGSSTMVEDLGHEPIEAGSGAAALAILDAGTPIDVVLTDQAMPGMTGLQLAQAVRARRPRLPLVLATGYAELPEGAESAVDARLAKPFGQDELMRVLARVGFEHGPDA
ncbi:PAS domain S-box protein [Salinarimonas chemoclinalis]|uniref:PAS domain S-box protein n=1 Tax=Salinarimonas chemoclinalis TaxID=3241599 RepID=UPI003558B968